MTHTTTWRAATAALLTIPLLAACETLPDMAHPLIGQTWKLTDIDNVGSSTRLTPALQERHTITFEDGGRAFLQLDCNRGNTSWSAENPRSTGASGSGSGSITIGPIASTKMLCPQPSFGETLGARLSDAETYTLLIDGRRLVIETEDTAFTFSAL